MAELSEEEKIQVTKSETKVQEKQQIQRCQLTYDNSNFEKISSKWTSVHTHDVPQAFWADI